jgi:Protein of unknown function (DUF1566)/PEP-CTERM motif
MKSTFSRMAVVALTLWLGLAAGAANADLIAADHGLTVYDKGTNLDWLANANLNGAMNWAGAQSWITSLNTADYLGSSDWRLPTSDGCIIYNCTGSEMGNLFYNELGGTANHSILTTHNADLTLFNNVQANGYWSGTEYAPDPSYAWNFGMSDGFQGVSSKGTNLFALAVRPGQVAAVPEPSTYVMLLAGLGLIGFTARRRKDFSA